MTMLDNTSQQQNSRAGPLCALWVAALILTVAITGLAHAAPLHGRAKSQPGVMADGGHVHPMQTIPASAESEGSDPGSAHGGKLGPAVSAAVEAAPEEPLSVIVHLRPRGPEPVGDQSVDTADLPPSYVESLQATYTASSADLIADLAPAQQAGLVADTTPLWIANSVALTAEPDVIRLLADRSDVRLVTLDEKFPLEPWEPEAPAAEGHPAGASGAPLWNIRVVRADDVWNLLGYDGTGVTVAIMDTGVDYHHPRLMTSYRGYLPGGGAQNQGNWWCTTEDSFCGFGSLYPVDGFGHGTHVAGTVLGGQGAGVAPGAQWIAARVCPARTCEDSWIIAGMQWLLAPGGRSELRPQVMNASFGTESRENGLLYKNSVDALVASGTAAGVSSGNNPKLVTAPGHVPIGHHGWRPDGRERGCSLQRARALAGLRGQARGRRPRHRHYVNCSQRRMGAKNGHQHGHAPRGRGSGAAPASQTRPDSAGHQGHPKAHRHPAVVTGA